MGTQAMIAIHDDGDYHYITCHYDGYWSYMRPMLSQHYTYVNKVWELIDGGNISVLGERLEPIGEHSFSKPEEGTTIFYARDRGERLQKGLCESYRSLMGMANWHGIRYVYIYDTEKGHWNFQENTQEIFQFS